MTGYIITGILFGIIGGMGMGGGVILIPVFTLIFGIGQHEAQSVNLIVFIPMAMSALFLHIKNKLIDFKKGMLIMITGFLGAYAGTKIAVILNEVILKKIFGIFLISLALYRFYKFLKMRVKN